MNSKKPRHYCYRVDNLNIEIGLDSLEFLNRSNYVKELLNKRSYIV